MNTAPEEMTGDELVEAAIAQITELVTMLALMQATEKLLIASGSPRLSEKSHAAMNQFLGSNNATAFRLNS